MLRTCTIYFLGNRATIGAIVGVVGGGVVGVTITLIVVLVVYFCNKEKVNIIFITYSPLAIIKECMLNDYLRLQ